MRWSEFAASCPEIASIAEERFARDQLVMLGTLRSDGAPRISPCEVDMAGSHLFLGMMWRSKKALDLRRDPRIVVHSVTCNKDGTDGDIKLYGRAIEEHDQAVRATFREAIRARIDWAPDEPEYHLFSLDVQSAGYLRFSDGSVEVKRWTAETGLQSETRASD